MVRSILLLLTNFEFFLDFSIKMVIMVVTLQKRGTADEHI